MKADWDDAPFRVRKKKNHNTLLALVLVTTATLLGAFYFFGPEQGLEIQLSENIAFKLPTGRVSESAAMKDNPYQPIVRAVEDSFYRPAERATESNQEDTAIYNPKPANTNSPRQVVFTDQNYTPKTSINTIKSPTIVRTQASNQRVDHLTAQRSLNGMFRTMLQWDGGWWKGPYEYANGVINYDDFCASQKYPRKGSIEYRACRKEAKTYLRNECRSGRSKSQEIRRMYCQADDAFRH